MHSDLSKVLDHLKGIENEHTIYSPLRRQSLHDTGSRRLPEDLKVEDLLSGSTKANSPLEGGEKCEDSGVGPSTVVGTSD